MAPKSEENPEKSALARSWERIGNIMGKVIEKFEFLGWPTSPKCGKYNAKSMFLSLASTPLLVQF